MSESLVRAEFRQADVENRQPRCPYCREPLVVVQSQRITLFWRWLPKEKAYENRVSEGDAYQPFCAACRTRDWDFLDAPMSGQTGRPLEPKNRDKCGPGDANG